MRNLCFGLMALALLSILPASSSNAASDEKKVSKVGI